MPITDSDFRQLVSLARMIKSTGLTKNSAKPVLDFLSHSASAEVARLAPLLLDYTEDKEAQAVLNRVWAQVEYT